MEPIDFSTRLINRGGDERDVLLAQGHQTMCALPLLIFSLLHCDPLRLSEGYYQPSTDSRLSAAAHLASMSPTSLVKSLAPRLELWANSQDEDAELPRVNLGRYAVELAVAHSRGSAAAGAGGKPTKTDAVLLLDSPKQVLVFAADPQGKGDAHDLGPTLKQKVELAAASYRCPPPIHYVRAGTTEAGRMDSALVEDFGDGYANWCDGVGKEMKGILFDS